MAILKKEFKDFHKEIKLKKYEENKDLREKRDLLVNELRNSLKDEKIPNIDKKLTFTSFDQGSYAMNTGIKPKDDDYDIDIGIIFDITNGEYDSAKLKKLVRDKLNKINNRTVIYNRPCITVEYLSEKYHVDLAVYAKNNDDMHIAWGKEFSNEKTWYKSEPKKLTKWVADVSCVSYESAQFRRCVRYLKKWKEKHFQSKGNDAPPSIGLTIQARQSHIYDNNDLNALIHIVKYIKNSFTDNIDTTSFELKKCIVVNLPVEPFKNVYYKMSLNQQNNFYKKVDALLEILIEAKDEESEYKASKLLQNAFGDEFPLVEDIKESRNKPYVTTGNNA